MHKCVQETAESKAQWANGMRTKPYTFSMINYEYDRGN